MRFTEAVRHSLSHYATFSGRASRSEYWWFALFLLLGQIVCSVLDTLLFGTGQMHMTPHGAEYMDQNGPLGIVFTLATLLPAIAVAARRLHDTDRSAWWLLIGLIPLIGGIVLLVFLLGRSRDEGNRFAPAAP